VKKILLILFLILFLPGICLAESEIERIGNLDTAAILDPGGYKGAKWGMTEEEVKQVIPNVVWGDGWSLIKNAYRDTILDHKVITLNTQTSLLKDWRVYEKV